MDMLIFWSGIIILLGISVLIGFLRGAQTSVEWMSAKHETGLLLLTSSIIGTMIGGAMFVAVTVMGYENGIIGIYIGISYAFGLVILGLASHRISFLLEKTQSETIFHLIEHRISHRVGFLYALISGLLFGGIKSEAQHREAQKARPGVGG